MSFSALSTFCFLVSLSPAVFSCLANGVCGPGFGCISQTQQHQPLCQPACGPGYHCGPYGCTQVRARARGSNLFQPDLRNEEPKSLNQLFMECCEARGLPKACLEKCSLHNYTRETVSKNKELESVFINMYFKRDSCPVSAAAEIQFCAAQGRDHRDCCVRNGVGTTLAGDKCLIFCDQRPGKVTQLDYGYLICYDRFESMKNCFWQDMTTRNLSQRFSRLF
uniref:Domain of unknown function DB domain-containing protein n=1 Tax=Setaria digitata TaxID=48799 RepID=A0A915Q4I2_9BILA